MSHHYSLMTFYFIRSSIIIQILEIKYKYLLFPRLLLFYCVCVNCVLFVYMKTIKRDQNDDVNEFNHDHKILYIVNYNGTTCRRINFRNPYYLSYYNTRIM